MAFAFSRPNTNYSSFQLLIILCVLFDCCIFLYGEKCPASMFECVSGGCVNATMVCDDIEDCKDASDEHNCAIDCPDGWFHCTNGNCIVMRWRCDGANDCGDRSDEINCGAIAGPCDRNEFRCHDNSKCIAMEWVCDGNEDCTDGSDEAPGCTRRVPCNGFTCKGVHAECLPSRWHCDGSIDCDDGSDEQDCTGPKNVSCSESDLQFWCVDRKLCLDKEFVCNGIKNCDDGSDEGGQCDTHTCNLAGCSHTCFQTPSSTVCYCPSGYTLMYNKTCNDIDECKIPGSCSHICENRPGGFSCSCQQGYRLEDDQHSCRVEGPEPILIYSATQELHVIKLHSGLAYSIHHQLNHAVGVDYDSQEDRIYWTEIAQGSEAIKSSKLDGTDIQLLVTAGINVVEDVAIDWIGRNLYLTDSGFMRICVCKEDGRFCHVLMDDIKQPRALVLVPAQGLMFWTDWSHSAAIERAGMDGSERVPLVNSNLGWPNGLAIDHITQRLYWIDGKLRRVESVALDGSDRRVAFSDTMLHPFSLALFEDTFYWTDWVRHTLESCNKWTAGDHKVLIKEENDNTPMGVHLYHPILQAKSNNPCWGSGCEQLCLLAPAGRYTCVCQLGDQLAPNGKFCLDNKAARLFVSLEDTIYEFLEAEIGRNVLQPLAARAKLLVGAMSYNPINRTIVYSDVGSNEIVALSMDTETQNTLVNNHLNSVEGIAVDWISGNIYWIDSRRGTLEVCRSDGNSRKIIVDRRLDRPSALALEPIKGFMFVATKGNRPRIEKMDMDGSERHVFIDYDVMAPLSLTIDFSKDRLYWADDHTGKIEWVSLDGKERNVMKDYKGLPKSVAVTNNTVHWIDVSGDVLLYKYNESSLSMDSVGLHPRIDDHVAGTVKLLAIHQSYPKSDVGCGSKNGRCSHLCLPNQMGHICGCPTGMALGSDKFSCQAEVECNSLEFTCSDKTCIPLVFTCDGKKDCDDGTDEQNCRPICTNKQFQCDDGACIPESWQCDHKPQCGDESDEINCKNDSCPANHYTCNNGECIFDNWKCDGEADCHDKSDELYCPQATCPPNHFQCKSAHCIPESWMCDGEPDCRDGTDEFPECLVKIKKCDTKNQFSCTNGRCIDNDLVCDMDDDCGDGSDELHCNLAVECPSNMYKCASSTRCILEKTRCDGVKDCPKGDDEESCKKDIGCKAYEFQCPERKSCISQEWLCDGENDCGDNSDETLPQCHHNAQTSTSVVLQDVEFEHRRTEVEDSKEKLTSMKATPKIRPTCNQEEYQCSSGECIRMTDLCNHRINCTDGSDEGPFCSTACAVDNGGCLEMCLPTPTGPLCRCRTGFFLSKEDKRCYDIDECERLGTCSQHCHNVPGTFVCTCATGYTLRSDHRSCKAEGAAPKLLLAFRNKLLAYTLGANNIEVIAHKDEFDIRDADFDSKLGDIYWIDYIKGSIFKYSPSSTNSSTSIVLNNLENPTALAVDWISRLLIFWDANGYLEVCTLDGLHCANILYIGQRNVRDIEVDARTGKIYWTSWSSSASVDDGAIEQTCANGRQRSILASEKMIWPSGLTLDYIHESIFWVDVHLQVIETMELNGRNRRTITRKDVTYPMVLAMFEDLLYWADWGKNAIIRCDKFTCEDRVVILENVIKVTSMVIYHPTQQPNESSPCTDQSNECSHICVKVPRGYSCLCPSGMEFNSTANTTCVPITKHPRSGFQLEKCEASWCFNGGSCFMRHHHRICVCQGPWTGKRCETRVRLVSDFAGTSENHEENRGWVAGVIVGMIFVLAAAAAIVLYYRRFGSVWPSKDKLRGSFAPIPFVNPLFGANGEPLDEDYSNQPTCIPYENPDESYRSYSNPVFEGESSVDINSNMRDCQVKFHASEPSQNLDSESTSKDSTSTLVDITPGLPRRHH